ncbi:MAG TPA: hypothetical protein VGJ21_13315 [Terracidiphilus sp.]|jgi:hypothetical protein
MRFGKCNCERELAEALEQGFWPDACSAELRAHVEDCKSCSERVLMTRVFRRERAFAAGAARLESPGAIWWRAQLRRRNADLERIRRPILGAQVFAVAVALITTAVFFASQAKQSAGWFAWIADIPRSLHLEALVPTALQSGYGVWALIAGTVLMALAGGVFAWFASDGR